MVPDVEKIVISKTTEEAIMNNKFWNEFYQSGKISDYLNYVNSSEHTARSQSAFGGSRYSDEMEKMQDAGKSDRNGAFGDSRGGIR